MCLYPFLHDLPSAPLRIETTDILEEKVRTRAKN